MANPEYLAKLTKVSLRGISGVHCPEATLILLRPTFVNETSPVLISAWRGKSLNRLAVR